MAMLQLIITKYSRRTIGFLCVNCIFIRYFWHWTRPDPPIEDGEFCDPTHGWTRPMSNSAPDGPDRCPTLHQMDPTDVQLCTKSQVTVEFEAHVQPTVASQLVTRVACLRRPWVSPRRNFTAAVFHVAENVCDTLDGGEATATLPSFMQHTNKQTNRQTDGHHRCTKPPPPAAEV